MPLAEPLIDDAPLVANVITGKDAARTIGVNVYDASGGGDQNYRTRLAVRVSDDPDFVSPTWYYSGYFDKGFTSDVHTPVGPGVAYVNVPALDPNTKYYVRVSLQRSNGVISSTLSGSFYTNRPPVVAVVSPLDGTGFTGSTPVPFDWTFSDPDASLGSAYNTQNQYQLRWRTAATPLAPAGAWTTITLTTATTSADRPAADFSNNTQYEWQVRARDNRFAYSAWTDSHTFFMGGATTVPVLLAPVDDGTLDPTESMTFSWKFRDPDQTQIQTKADIRYREVGTAPWTTLTGTTTTPGTTPQWVLAAGVFISGVHYEWQARTTNTTPLTSEWSPSELFWMSTVGANSGPIIPALSEAQHMLGVGNNEAFIYSRGGRKRIGQVKPMAKITWNRKRDDISNCDITTNGFGEDNGELLASIRTWRHEVVVFRDGERVWEGPITRITWKNDKVEIVAKDVMVYVYRRIMRQAYNDAYKIVSGLQLGLKSVVYRSRAIIMNALSYDDPNVLPYLTALVNEDDTVQSRVVAGYSKSAWSEVDDMAATAGLDYTVVGRRIILADTHRGVGLLTEMGDGDFSDHPIVTEYGMQAANVFAVTNNSGVSGMAIRLEKPDWATSGDPDVHGNITSRDTVWKIPPEGYIEQIASAYGESVGAATPTTLTAAAKAKLQETLRQQAQRNIAHRWPVPVMVRVPDNTTLSPELNIGINQLVPGVWIPLRAVGTLRKVTKMQKLDSISVTQTGENSEQIQVIMSPAPLAGDDEAIEEE